MSQPLFYREKDILGDGTSPALLPISASTLRRYIADGKFPQPKALGRCKLWSRAEVNDCLSTLPVKASK